DKYDATTDEYKLKIEGYSLDEDKLPINSVGTLSDTDQTVTYVYKQDPIKANDVTVHYVDETGKEIHEVQQINGINISKNEESKDLSRTLPKTREDIKFNKKISILGLLVLCCTYIGLFKKRKGV
ncbi:MucBP domain-containing protein, partial [Enterococcus mundtii]|uniref:MucBP domain-containing protein n=1 Tax=Enterococcus mundtii TaxID=53346 RepID=UPI00163D3E92